MSMVQAYAPIGVRDFTTHPLRKVKTPAAEFAAFCKKLDVQNAKRQTWRAIHAAPSCEDAQLLARLDALPRPAWMQALANYTTHTQRMRDWFKELDKAARPLVWHPISAERALMLATHTTLWGRLEWPDKRRTKVQAIAASRGDIFEAL